MAACVNKTVSGWNFSSANNSKRIPFKIKGLKTRITSFTPAMSLETFQELITLGLASISTSN